MISAARKYNVPLGVLYAVGLTETGRRNSLYPYALNIEGKSVFPPSRQAAKQDVIDAQQHGKKLIDIGCMQINHHYHGDQFRSVDQMLEPRANVQYAARFLKDLRRRQGSWTMAVARYHAGPNNDPAQKTVCLHGDPQHGCFRFWKLDTAVKAILRRLISQKHRTACPVLSFCLIDKFLYN
jgi:hypothetical protein